MKKFLAAIGIVTMLTLTACSSGNSSDATDVLEVQLDLTGTWVEEGQPDSTQVAHIEGETITINWVNHADKSEALYWQGTIPTPNTTDNRYEWSSERDKEATDMALLASTADSKDFTYANGVLEYEVTALGVTRTIELVRE